MRSAGRGSSRQHGDALVSRPIEVPKSLIVRYVLAGIALAGACFSGLLGLGSYLFHKGDRQSVETAARLIPFNPTYLARLSGYEPAKRTELLKRAAALDPFSTQVWLQLGFDAEFHHADFAGAEKYYLRSASVSHLFLPRWTLANYYFRRQDKPAFMHWAHAALEITPYTADPIFTEMWLLDPDHSRLDAELPDRPGILVQYLSFLMNARQFGSVPPIIERLVALVPAESAPAFGLYDIIGPELDGLIGAGYVAESLRAWRALSSHQWIPFSTPTPDRPLTNGEFAPIYSHGFDWSIVNNGGASSSQPRNSRGIDIELTGYQPENCELLRQWIPVGPSRRYRMQWKVESSGLTNPAGLIWRIRAGNADLGSPDLLSDHSSGWEFQTPSKTEIASLSLEFQRPLGHIKSSGSLRLQSVTIEAK
jgi:hypothetical protein